MCRTGGRSRELGDECRGGEFDVVVAVHLIGIRPGQPEDEPDQHSSCCVIDLRKVIRDHDVQVIPGAGWLASLA
ncbi:hypothetical protein BJY24_005804 [Nocardia transvalensis]|uniref:Uncharacterized protein n=1 Tax=Nocardia transvalensis TaxID=37333 RepID=A0A7W9UL14_9NOCA|nr:hypothetical protein [Nocardia transvalensis]